MQTTTEINLFDSDYSQHEQDFEVLSQQESFRLEVDQGLEESLQELQHLKSKLSDGQSVSLIELCKDNIIQTINSQFGLASLVMDNRDGGNVTTAYNDYVHIML